MPVWDEAVAILYERSSEGNTATVLGPADAALAMCDDAGRVAGPGGATLLTAALSFPHGAISRATGAHVEVRGGDGVPAGALAVRRYTITPFSKRLTLALVAPGGAEVGELGPTDRKGRGLAVTCGGSEVARLAQTDRDRGVRRSVERWSLEVRSRPAPPADLLVAAAILRYVKVLTAVGVQARDRRRP